MIERAAPGPGILHFITPRRPLRPRTHRTPPPPQPAAAGEAGAGLGFGLDDFAWSHEESPTSGGPAAPPRPHPPLPPLLPARPLLPAPPLPPALPAPPALTTTLLAPAFRGETRLDVASTAGAKVLY